MEQVKLCASDYRFMSLVWENEPINSTQLAKTSLDVLGWKKSTTYTMLKKLSDKGYLQNNNSIVTSTISKSDVRAFESGYVIDNMFDSSLPAFIAAFIKSRPLNKDEIDEIQALIEQNTED